MSRKKFRLSPITPNSFPSSSYLSKLEQNDSGVTKLLSDIPNISEATLSNFPTWSPSPEIKFPVVSTQIHGDKLFRDATWTKQEKGKVAN